MPLALAGPHLMRCTFVSRWRPSKPSGLRIWHSPCWRLLGSWLVTSGHTGLLLPLRCVRAIYWGRRQVDWDHSDSGAEGSRK